MTGRRLQLVLLSFVVGLAVGIGGLLAWQSAQAHYEYGTVRLGTYSVAADDRSIVLATPLGWSDVRMGISVAEDADKVTVTVGTWMYVPGRNGFKQLTASLDTLSIPLKEPLGVRVVVDGGSGKVLRRS